MKKQILIGMILFGSIMTVNAQWNGTSPNPLWTNSNVGIGTPNPATSLDITGGTSSLSVTYSTGARTAGYFATLYSAYAENTGYLAFAGASGSGKVIGGNNYGSATSIYANNTERMRILNNGNVGIGTPNPATSLDITGGTSSLSVTYSAGARTAGYFATLYSAYAENTGYLAFAGASGSGKVIGGINYGSETSIYANNTERMRILNNGNVGIGTDKPCYKLDVYGTIRTDEVIVNLTHGCDFVFKNDYKLMDLKKLEEFVKTNQHLPEIASEKEMVENGVNMKDLQMKLLRKMEEMTLYIIEQNKKLEEQNEKIGTIEEQNKLLKQEIELLKTK